MLDRMEDALCKALVRIRFAISKFMNEEEGNAVETIVIIAVGVIVAGALLNFLTKDGFTNQAGEKVGLVAYMFDQIKTKFDGFFS